MRDDLSEETTREIKHLAIKVENESFEGLGIMFCDSKDILEDVRRVMKAMGYSVDQVSVAWLPKDCC